MGASANSADRDIMCLEQSALQSKDRRGEWLDGEIMRLAVNLADGMPSLHDTPSSVIGRRGSLEF